MRLNIERILTTAVLRGIGHHPTRCNRITSLTSQYYYHRIHNCRSTDIISHSTVLNRRAVFV